MANAPQELVTVWPALRPTRRRAHLAPAELAVGFVAGVVGVLLIGAAISDHGWIGFAVAFPIGWLLVAAAARKPALVAGYVIGSATVIAAFIALVVVVVATGNFTVGGP